MANDSTERLTRLWTESQPIVASFILSLVPDYHQAEDILQQVATVIVREFDRYDPTRPFLSWALGIARNQVLKSRRTYARDSSRFVFDVALVKQVESAFQEPADHWGAVRQSLRECLKQLRTRQLEALRLRYVYNLGSQEAAHKMGITSGAVRVILHRVRALLRQCVQSRMEAPR